MNLDLSAMSLDAVEALIAGMDTRAKAQLQASVGQTALAQRVWLSQPGPQTLARESEADELLYGGAAGGGKTDLIVGLALTEHRSSVIYRRQANDLDDLWSRLTEVAEPITTKNDGVKKQMRTKDGRTVFGGHLEKPGSEKSAMGRARDFIGFDEGAQLDEYKVEFVTRWLRTTRTGQRCRVVIATNPPIPEMIDGQLVDNGSGDWLMRWFAPWLDDRFPNPARQGELRWCYMRRDGDRLTTIWVDGPGAYDATTGLALKSEDVTEDMIYQGKVIMARSRTFIRSLLKDNVFLRNSGYAERMASTPEPLKSMLLLGLFTVKAEDHNMQVIPTLWVLQAQERWMQRQHERSKLTMLVLAADIAQGGADTTVLAPLMDTAFYEELKVAPGRDTPTGREVVTNILQVRKDKALIVLDAGGGWAGSTTVLLEDNHDIKAEQFLGSRASTEWTLDMIYKYFNGRAEVWWKFREALDPKSGEEICLPPSDRLLAQLTAPHWKPKGKMLVIEEKVDVRKRLSGASTDEADAVIIAWAYREQAIAERVVLDVAKEDVLIYGVKRAKRMAVRRMQSPDMEDPLRDWS